MPPTHSRTQRLARLLARTATHALRAEVDLTPKPGLVDRRDAGAHNDMTHALMTTSCNALESGFHDMALAACREHDPYMLRVRLGLLGRESEARMLLATGGVNTHRGAIWALGLLVAAAASQLSHWRAPHLLDWVAGMAAIDDPAVASLRVSNGQRVVQTYGVPGARGEAEQGLAQIPQAALPVLRASRTTGASERVSRLNALLALMTVLEDTCVLSRAGADGLRRMQDHAASVLGAGGAGTLLGARRLAALDRFLLDLNASPGGSADLLAATLFIDTLEHIAREKTRAASTGTPACKETFYANANA